MTSICPFSRELAHNYLIVPYLQGTREINKAWQGVDCEHLARPTLSLKTRLICCLRGIVLMIPCVNTIVWLAWQTFGSPEPLQENFSPEDNEDNIDQSAYAPNVDSGLTPLISAITPIISRRAPTYSYTENTGTASTTFDWTVDPIQDRISVHLSSPIQHSQGLCNTDGTSKEYHYNEDQQHYSAWLESSGKIKVASTNKGASPIITELTRNLSTPWIQEPLIGLKEFMLSSENSKTFSSIINQGWFGLCTPYLISLTATKAGSEVVDELGRLTKVMIKMSYTMIIGTLWFDSTGVVRKYTRKTGMNSQTTGILTKTAATNGQ